ncbi:von Willebrand factor A domain-containing protein 7 [Megalops cyprinoides]|uniref:von Willebrand factor A domain-containing protein 7 n=1 Tax=Megalops cyprinoides TaxID=118141 RepID=UPI0018649D49|nr:von Willebrand factor A domain-containing protein 7 [Megalops cyprinoides]
MVLGLSVITLLYHVLLNAGSVSMVLGLSVAVLALTLSGVGAFTSMGGSSRTHADITETAVLRVTADVCRAVAHAEGRSFSPRSSSAEDLLQECLGSARKGEVSAAKFKAALNQIYFQNGQIDRDFGSSDRHHFSSEAFNGGRVIITMGVTNVKANIRHENFQAARENLGRVCHTLQDFYSHSNWIEMGHRSPYVNLIRPEMPILNTADRDTPTCRDCAEKTCRDNILPQILTDRMLTSGYIGLTSPFKPAGKCSHGGDRDLTSSRNPRGGISKDEDTSSHGYLHRAAADAAVSATVQLLEDIRAAAGDNNFLRLMGITRSSVLCFVIDTTGSMSDDIAEAKRVAFSIIDSKKGTADEPSSYILVPFNDPEFGPLIKTRDPDVMKARISELTASGGGDTPEMSLSGLQLALTGAPPSSQIFVFTDAPAKDVALKSTVIALIRSTKSVVSFFLTNVLTARRRRDSGQDQHQGQGLAKRATTSNQLYQELAVASGGQAIEVTKATLPQATDIIVDTSTSALVTILQTVRKVGSSESFSFLVDASVRNLTVYITGSSLSFTLRSPSGMTQKSSVTNGPLGTLQAVGNLRRVQLHPETGLWEISIDSSQPYTLKVTGQSSIAFIYEFMEAFEGLYPGYAVIDGLPHAGKSATLLLTMTGSGGSNSLTVAEVSLVEVSGSRAENGTARRLGNGDYLVSLDKIPEGEFVVLVKGVASSSLTPFQRQSTTEMRVSQIIIRTQANASLEPGVPFSLPFTVTTNGTSGWYTITARDDRSFITYFTSGIALESGGSGDASVELTAPSSTPSGTDVTLTIDIEGPGAVDSNYAVLRLSVVTKVTDFSRPVCTVLSVTANCSEDCSGSQWELSANLTDGTGTGIQSVSTRLGNGTLNTTPSTGEGGVDVTLATYSASCCSPEVEIVAVDTVGNVGTCFHSIRPATTATPITAVPASSPRAPAPSLGLCFLASALYALCSASGGL